MENPLGDPPQPSENFTQADPPGSNNAQHQDTTEGPTSGNLREGADQRDQINHPTQVPTEAPLHMARMPQAIGNYGLGARLPGSFTGGAVMVTSFFLSYLFQSYLITCVYHI